jgi:tRNA pseudouridine synthase 9
MYVPSLGSETITDSHTAHQIRVHLQFLGHPIANDTLYRDPHIWGASLGRGGLDTTPSDIRAAPAAPSHLDSGAEVGDSSLPRETGHDIGSGSPVPLSAEAVGVITRLRALKDADEGWARWRDTAFRGRGALRPSTVVRGPDVTERARREEGKKAAKKRAKKAQAVGTDDTTLPPKVSGVDTAPPPDEPVPARTTAQVMAVYAHIPAQPPTAGDDGTAPLPETARAAPFVDELEPTLMLEDATYCAECFLPLPPDPTLDKLYIFLHALRYTSALGTFATDLPEWAAADFTWAGYVPVVPR